MWLKMRQFDTRTLDWILDGKEPEYFTAPALDPAYDFKVVVYCSRQAGRRRRVSWWQMDRDEFCEVYEILRDTIRQTTRQFPIFDPGAAEQAINAFLVSRLDDAHRKTRILAARWEARAEVTLPDEVLTLMRNVLSEQHQISEQAKATAMRMAKTDELRQGWDRFLDDAAKSQNAEHAVQLAEDPHNIAQVLADVLNDRRKGAEDLVTLIDKIVEVQRSTDILDLVVRSETVLRKTLEMMGIQLPPMREDSLLVPLEGEP
jgi:hypothetical protein